MGLRKKILLGYGCFILCIIAFGIFATSRALDMQAKNSDSNYAHLQLAEKIHNISTLFHIRTRLIEEVGAGFADVKESIQEIEAAEVQSAELLKYFDRHQNELNANYRKELSAFHVSLSSIAKSVLLGTNSSNRAKVKASLELLDKSVPDLFSKVDAMFDDLINHSKIEVKTNLASFESLLFRLWITLAAILFGSFAIAYVFTKFLSTTILNSVHEVQKISAVIANETYGGPTGQSLLQSDSEDDEIHHLSRAINLLKIGLQRSTDLKEALESERTKSAFSSKLASLGEMAGGIAHEVNTPLAIISIRASQLREFLAEDKPDFAMMSEMAADIESTCLRIAKIIKSLKSFSRDGSHDPFMTQSLSRMVDDCVAFCAQRFKENSVSLQIAPIPEGILVECRETEIIQVLLNLLNNSFDAIEKLPEKWVKLTHTDFGDSIEIRVTDSGHGIPDDVQKKLFQPFFTTKEVGKGTGLGLGISKRIIENHGGILIINSDSANTEFIIWLSKKRSDANQPISSQAS